MPFEVRAIALTSLAFLLGIIVPGCGSTRSGPFEASTEQVAPAFSCASGVDCDGDGYPAGPDCNDSNPNIGPEAYDFIGDGIDNDCDGIKDNPVETCETIPTSAPGSPTDFARAADLCPQRHTTKAGTVHDPLLRAEWGSVSGMGPTQRVWTSATKPEQLNIVSSFGANPPRRGRTMFGLATGPWAAPSPGESAPLDPPDFRISDACAAIPLDSADCLALSNGASSGGLSVQDWAELKLWLKAPANAEALSIDFAFFSSEFSQFWHSAMNDAFFVLVSDQKHAGTNVAKDPLGRAINVNSGFFQLCPKSPGPGTLSPDKLAALEGCVGNEGDAAAHVFGSLKGTGFDGASSQLRDGTVPSADGTKRYVYGGGTGWLTLKVPVTKGAELALRIIVHDTFDGQKDSLVMLDAFRWEPVATSGIDRPIR